MVLGTHQHFPRKEEISLETFETFRQSLETFREDVGLWPLPHNLKVFESHQKFGTGTLLSHGRRSRLKALPRIKNVLPEKVGFVTRNFSKKFLK